MCAAQHAHNLVATSFHVAAVQMSMLAPATPAIPSPMQWMVHAMMSQRLLAERQVILAIAMPVMYGTTPTRHVQVSSHLQCKLAQRYTLASRQWLFCD